MEEGRRLVPHRHMGGWPKIELVNSEHSKTRPVMKAVAGGSLLPQTHLHPTSEGVENAVVVVLLLLEHSLILSVGCFREQSPAPILNH